MIIGEVYRSKYDKKFKIYCNEITDRYHFSGKLLDYDVYMTGMIIDAFELSIPEHRDSKIDKILSEVFNR